MEKFDYQHHILLSTQFLSAAKEGNEMLVKDFIVEGINVDAKHDNGETALHFAARNGNLTIVNSLIEAKANLEAKDQDGDTPLHRAAWGGKASIVEALLESGADKEIKNNRGSPPLHWAAWQGQVETLKILLDAGARLDVADNDGSTALSWAVRNGHTRTVRALLIAGADIEVTTKDGWTPLHYAARRYADTKTVQVLLATGTNIEAKDKTGRTPLHHAVTEGLIEVVKILINAGAKWDERDNRGETALDLAKVYHRDRIVELLEKRIIPMMSSSESNVLIHKNDVISATIDNKDKKESKENSLMISTIASATTINGLQFTSSTDLSSRIMPYHNGIADDHMAKMVDESAMDRIMSLASFSSISPIPSYDFTNYNINNNNFFIKNDNSSTADLHKVTSNYNNMNGLGNDESAAVVSYDNNDPSLWVDSASTDVTGKVSTASYIAIVRPIDWKEIEPDLISINEQNNNNNYTIGSGSFGFVVRAKWKTHRVAVKVVLKDRSLSNNNRVFSEDLIFEQKYDQM
eukprot:gene13927-18677_t